MCPSTLTLRKQIQGERPVKYPLDTDRRIAEPGLNPVLQFDQAT